MFRNIFCESFIFKNLQLKILEIKSVSQRVNTIFRILYLQKKINWNFMFA